MSYTLGSQILLRSICPRLSLSYQYEKKLYVVLVYGKPQKAYSSDIHSNKTSVMKNTCF